MRETYLIEVRRQRLSWYWRLVAANGEVLAHSETYVRKSSAVKTAQSLADALGVDLVV